LSGFIRQIRTYQWVMAISQELAQGDDVGIGAFVEPRGTRHE
jgi:hypothetical protein